MLSSDQRRQTHDLAREALRLARAGMTYRQIGDHFGVGPSRASDLAHLGERLERYHDSKPGKSYA